MKNKMWYLVIVTFYLQISSSSGNSTENATSINNEEENSPASINYTISELIDQRTEDIKKIVADQNQQQTSTIEYPVVTKLEPTYSEEVKKQIEKLSIEELKIKCQHLSKLFQVNKTNENKQSIQNGVNSNQNTLLRSDNHKPYSIQIRPVYIQPKTTLKPKHFTTTQKPNGFYITQNRQSTQKPTMNTRRTPVKYIRLEPVILQKTILSDGRTVYYWHRSLPTAVEIGSDTTQNNQIQTSKNQAYPSYNNYYGQPPIYNNFNNNPYAYGNIPYRYASWPQSPYASNSYIPAYQNAYTSTEDGLMEEHKSTEITTESSTTATTEQISYGYGFGSLFPFYGYGKDPTTTTTESTTTTTTTPGPTTEKLRPDGLLYAQQLKFVIPVPYEDLNGGASISARNPWDQYAYYPKELQPNLVNVQVPYNPTFHMIRAVAVPSSVSKVSDKIDP